MAACFRWTGNGYSEVGDRYKDYYRSYLKSLNTQLAAYSPESRPAAAHTTNAAPAVDSVLAGRSAIAFYNGPHVEGPAAVSGIVRPAPAPTSEAAPKLPDPADYACIRIEAAKTEAFLGIDSPSTMSAAIKDSENADPNRRILAAAVFSYFGSQQAASDLKTLGNDADPRVADIANKTASVKEDPLESYRRVTP